MRPASHRQGHCDPLFHKSKFATILARILPKTIFFLVFKNILFYVFVCALVHTLGSPTHALPLMSRSDDSFCEWSLLPLWVLGIELGSSDLCDKFLHLLTHLSVPLTHTENFQLGILEG